MSQILFFHFFATTYKCKKHSYLAGHIKTGSEPDLAYVQVVCQLLIWNNNLYMYLYIWGHTVRKVLPCGACIHDYFHFPFPDFINDHEAFEKSEEPLTRLCMYVLVDIFARILQSLWALYSPLLCRMFSHLCRWMKVFDSFSLHDFQN